LLHSSITRWSVRQSFFTSFRRTTFAIWDSKIYAFIFQKRPHNYRVNEVGNYRRYQSVLSTIRRDSRFEAFHASVNTKIGYGVSPLRAIELVMFLNAPVIGL
jgi:hypothetical protein